MPCFFYWVPVREPLASRSASCCHVLSGLDEIRGSALSDHRVKLEALWFSPMAEQDVLATAAGDLPYGRRQDPAAFLEFGQRPVAAVPRIDVEHDDIAADTGDTDIGVRIVTPPAADRRRVVVAR